MIEKDYTLKITTKDAEANLNQLNSTLKEQNEILIELEKELLKVQETQSKTSKTNLEGQRRLTKQADHLKNSIKDQKLGLKSLNLERREANTTLRDLNKTNTESVNIRRGIDKLTGGLATKVLKLKKGLFSSIKVIKNFIGGLNGIQKALIATGIGAFAVAVGLVVAYWEDLVALFDDGSKALQNQAKEINKNIELNNIQLTSLENQEKILQLQGKSTKAIKEEKKKILILQQEENRLLLENLKTQLLREKEQQKELTFYEKSKIELAKIFGGLGGQAIATANAFKQTEEEAEKLKVIQDLITKAKTDDQKITIKLLEMEKKASDVKKKNAEDEAKAIEKAEKEKAAAIERIRKGLIDTEAEERAEKLRLIQEDYNQQIELAAQFYGTNSIKILELRAAQKAAIDAQQAEFDAEDKKRQDKIDAEKKANDDKKLKDDEKIAKAKADLQNQLAGEVGNAISTIGNLFEEGTAASKASALAEIAIGTGMGFINALDIAQKSAKGTGPAAAFAFPIFYASQIAAVLGAVSQAKNILSTVKGGGGSVRTASTPSEGGTAPQIPAFNIVGASGESQLADAIGSQTQRPSRAYVVSNDVTTAQELDRNIIEGASI